MRSDLTGSLFKSDPRDVLSPLHWWLTCDATARQEDEELKEHVLKVSNLVSQSPYCTSVFSWVHPYFTSRNTKKIIFLNSQFLFLSPLIEWSHGWPEAVIVTRHEMMEEFYTTITPALITRFKEREENIKADIFHNYQALLKQASPQVR